MNYESYFLLFSFCKIIGLVKWTGVMWLVPRFSVARELCLGNASESISHG